MFAMRWNNVLNLMRYRGRITDQWKPQVAAGQRLVVSNQERDALNQ